ncbi:hypothetical protein IDJ75_15240 [Mucilaginibacter rigui]|uniref:Uncharacterized protein n=1 Tax=Mucilaginibacter rigui TaxID=534635 RepID=A0ABR7XAK8_9SPHI|nr:hypothetical protein [Mucilaginibacter rigui]MBD1386640.1 hypothetical protein [Mucilaginibacter rigui]
MENKYGGMTVNERLYVSGLWEKFDDAVAQKDIDLVIAILKKVELNDSNIQEILKFNGFAG